MSTRKYHQQEKILYERLKKTVIITLAIPFSILMAFLIFGPRVGIIFSIFSGNNDTAMQDNSAPAAPIFKNPPTFVKDTQIKLEGFAEEGAQVKLFVNGPEKQTTVASAESTFTFENIELINGKNTISAKAIDKNGNESEQSQVISISVDNDKPKIDIESPKAGAIVRNLDKRISVIGKINEKATIKVNERFAIQKPDLSFEIVLGAKEGEQEIVVLVTDQAGNEAEEKFKVTYLNQSP